jgi:hypothetical protein
VVDQLFGELDVVDALRGARGGEEVMELVVLEAQRLRDLDTHTVTIGRSARLDLILLKDAPPSAPTMDACCSSHGG